MSATPPGAGRSVELAVGIEWLRLPNGRRHRNVWRFAAKRAWHLVDSGHRSGANRALWKRLLRKLPVDRLIVTDSEPGAVANAHYLTDAPVLIAEHHLRWAQYLARMPPEIEHDLRTRFYREYGMDAAQMLPLLDTESWYQAFVPDLPRRYQLIADGQGITLGDTDWLVLSGEAPGGLSLYSASAQMVITGALDPSIIAASFAEPDEDRLTGLLAMLQRLEALPETTLVLPPKGSPHRTLHRQIARLRRRIGDRTGLVIEACRKPASAGEIAAKLWPDQPAESGFGEVVALLNHLAATGRVERQRDHGVRFRAIG